MIPYGRQDITADDINAVVDVLNGEMITQGNAVPEFEEVVASYTGAKYAIAVNSATSALHLAYAGLGLQAGDLLWTTPITFVATANAGRLCGARVDFVDVDPFTGNMSVAALTQKLKAAEHRGDLPKLLVAVHYSGRPCDMEAIHALARQYKFKVVEDASHAIGGCDASGKIGNCRYSSAVIFSFHPVKIVTTGEGGMLLTNSKELADQARLLRSHGITRSPDQMEGKSEGDWYYQQLVLGFNYRMTDFQAALGKSQMQRIEQYLAARRSLVRRYDELLEELPVIRPPINHLDQSAWHLYVIGLKPDFNRKDIFDYLRNAGIGVNVHYIPVHLQPYYAALGFLPGDFPVAEKFYRHSITLPLFPGLSFADQDFVVASLRNALSVS